MNQETLFPKKKSFMRTERRNWSFSWRESILMEVSCCMYEKKVFRAVGLFRPGGITIIKNQV
jgi:hypothetical protein